MLLQKLSIKGLNNELQLCCDKGHENKTENSYPEAKHEVQRVDGDTVSFGHVLGNTGETDDNRRPEFHFLLNLCF